MTNDEAIILLKSMKYKFPTDKLDLLSNMALDIAIKALENEPKKGKWINREAKCNTTFPFWERYECPYCHKYSGYSSFCQHCNADMREVNK